MLSKLNIALVLSLAGLAAAVYGFFQLHEVAGWISMAVALWVAEWRITQ